MTHVARLSLATGSVLMVATGFVDAYTFLRHGHVFAQAMTGNLVLIAIGAFDPAVVAFVIGVAVVWAWSRRTAPWRPGPQLATLGLTALVGFVGSAFLGAFLTTRIGERAAWVDTALFAVAAGLYVVERIAAEGDT